MRGETKKARLRRAREGFFGRFILGDGIDIGCQIDPVVERFRKWDLILGDSDATLMEGVPDDIYDTVYASHILEHLENPETAVRNWFRITSPGGHMIIVVPHRDLYERKDQPPSNWNWQHKFFFLPDKEEPPGVLSLQAVINRAIPNANILSLRVLNDGWEERPKTVHATGEYSIEAIVKKVKP
jgi:SAM-dependent methyltransferase